MSVIRRWDKSKPPTGPFALNRDCPQAQGLVAWWPMGKASGGRLLFDEAGKAHLSGTASSMVLGPRGEPLTGFNGSSTVFNASTAPVSAMPLTLASWGTSNSSSLVGSMLSVDSGLAAFGSANFFRLVVVGSASPKQVRANQGFSGGEVQATYGAGWVAGTEFHVVGVFTSTTSRAVYYNGALGASDTSSLSAPSLSQVNLGRHSVTGAEQWWSGTLGEQAVWNIALAADAIRRLYDPGTRFELWYPLRSRKWFTQGAGASGTSATTNANDTSSASGTTTVVGTLARTNAADTSSASGTTTLLGTSATTNAADTSSASGTVGGGVSGTSATTNANDTSSASGTTTVVGTSATTNAADTASASGTTTVTGTSATTNAADTATASGAAGTVTGTAAVTNADDTASASGVSGTPRTATGAGRSRRRRPHVVEIDGHDFVVGSAEEAEALLESARQEAEEVARKAVERASKVKNRPVRKVIADARKALAPPEIRAPGIEDYAAQVTQHIEALYADALRTIEIAALIAKREREDEDDEDVLLLMA